MEERSNSKNVWLPVVFLAGVGTTLAWVNWPKGEAPKPEEKPVVAQEAPKPAADPPPVTTPPGDDMKNTLLGLNTKPDPAANNIFNKPKVRHYRKMRQRPQHDEGDDDQTGSNDESSDDAFSRPQSGLSDADFHNTIERWRGVKSCLHAHKGRMEEGRGALSISMKIMPTGQVSETNVFDQSNELATTITPCVEKQARQLKFPSFEGEPFALKEAKFVF